MDEEGHQLASLRASSVSQATRLQEDMVAENEALESHVWRDERDDQSEEDELLKEQKTVEPLKHAKVRLFSSFVLFGLLNNVLYVIILSSALDLVSSSTPKGLIALFNIFPALIAKVFWPYLSNGTIRYKRRIYGCTAASWAGMVIIASFDNLYLRLLGIAFASFSSGLGELTFLQMSATLPSAEWSRVAIGAWSTGTGGAGIAGAGLWWLLRGLGVTVGLGISSFLPLFFPLTLHFLLPDFDRLPRADVPSSAYQPLATDPDAEGTPRAATRPPPSDEKLVFTFRDKWRLARPLLFKFMLPLFAVYVEEYVINSGVAPTLVFPVPTEGIWRRVFKSPRDYYPFWSLTYQSFVFLSRSSLSLGFPALPKALLPLPAIVQLIVLVTLSTQASTFFLSSPQYQPPEIPPSSGVDRGITFVFLLICLEGTCGGLAYVNTFFHVGREGDADAEHEDTKARMEREFRIGVTGAADSCGILFASLISMPVEGALCGAQVAKGRTLCRDL